MERKLLFAGFIIFVGKRKLLWRLCTSGFCTSAALQKTLIPTQNNSEKVCFDCLVGFSRICILCVVVLEAICVFVFVCFVCL
jgi:hypothetical protein